MLDNRGRYFPFVSFIQTREKIVKLDALAKTARLKATVRELLGFLRRKAPLAAQTASRGGEGKGKGSLPRHVFHTQNRFMGLATKFHGAPLLRVGRGPRRVEFPALIRHYAIFKSVPWNFFSLTRFYPVPPFSSSPLACPFSDPISCSPLDTRVFELAPL